MTRRILQAVGAAFVAVLLTCGSANAIVGGQLAGDRFGAVGEVVFQPGDGGRMFDLCSGFLISPTAFVTAGHCAIGALNTRASTRSGCRPPAPPTACRTARS